MNRYQRHIQLAEIGEVGQAKMVKAKVLVIGAGGLGCPALQYLTAAGVGTLGIIDGDKVELSNLQRQILFTEADIHQNKAEAAKNRLQQVNSTIEIKAFPFYLSPEQAEDIVSNFDIILDCTDNFLTRYLINDACLRQDKPFVHGSLFKFEGQIAVFNYQQGPSYRCLFPEPPKKGDIPNCNEVGVLGVLPGLIGTLQATEAIKMILGLGDVLSGKILHYHLLSHRQNIFELIRNESIIGSIKSQKHIELVGTDDCSFAEQISLDYLEKSEQILWVDVREPEETPKIFHPQVQLMPLSQIERSLENIPSQSKVIFFCASGMRSQKALAEAKKQNKINCHSLKEGAVELSNWLSS